MSTMAWSSSIFTKKVPVQERLYAPLCLKNDLTPLFEIRSFHTRK